MTPQAMFDGFDAKAFEAEAEKTWGETAQWKESKRRTARYSAADWDRFREEQSAQLAEMARALDGGVAPDDARAMDLAEQHRLTIERWFYPCPHALHRSLGAMYVADERFTATYERVATGLAAWLARAIEANADRHA